MFLHSSIRPPRLRLAGALLALIAATTASLLPAAELRLANGDRITGEVVSRADGKIHFRSPILGLLVVDETSAAIIETPDEPVESLAGLPPPGAQDATPAPDTTAPLTRPPAPPAVSPPPPVRLTPSVATTKPPKSGAAPVVAPPAHPPGSLFARATRGWKGKVELGYLQQSGRNEKVDLAVRVDAEKKIARDNFKASARYLSGEQNNRETSDRQEAAFRWRHDLTERMFGQSLTSYYSDGIKKIDDNFEQNAGLGYKVLVNPRHAVNAGGGLTGQYRAAPTIIDGWSYLVEAFEDYTFKMNSRFTFRQEASFFYALDTPDLRTQAAGTTLSTEEYRFKLNSSLQGALTERVSVNLRYEYEYDGTVSERDLRGDQRITTSLGYAF